MSNEKETLHLRFANKSNLKPVTINTHRGCPLFIAPAGKEDIYFGRQKDVQKAISYYNRFRSVVEVTRLDVPKVDKVIEKKEELPLEPEELMDNPPSTDEEIEDTLEEEIEESEEEIEEESEEDESERSEDYEFTREELEAMSYTKLVKLAKSKGVESRKKEDILKALAGE